VNTTGTPIPNGKLPPLTVECVGRCDLNKDGVITKDDFSNASTTSTDVLQFCMQSCPWADGAGGTGGGPGGPVPNTTTTPSRRIMGDCSGSQPGIADGKVNLQDVEYFRQELNKEVSTKACDFDQSGVTDIIDFTNYLRVGYSQFNQGEGVPGGTIIPTPISSNDSPQPTVIIVPPAGDNTKNP
jgi:hypothetical protein